MSNFNNIDLNKVFNFNINDEGINEDESINDFIAKIKEKSIGDILSSIDHDKDIGVSLFTTDPELQNININCIINKGNINYVSLFDNDTQINYEPNEPNKPFSIISDNYQLGGKNEFTNFGKEANNDENNKEINDFVSKYIVVRTKNLEKHRNPKRFTKSKRK
jgi:hypothetical protein